MRGNALRIFRPPKTAATEEHYRKVMSGGWKGRLWGFEKRFDPLKGLTSPSVAQHFTQRIAGCLSPSDKVLDLGCGSGLFLPIVSPRVRELVGLDVSEAMVESSRDVVRRLGLDNTTILLSPESGLPFPDEAFDVLLLVDTIHHVYHLDQLLLEARRVLKKGGRVLVFEPNKLNPALFAMCLLDRNEWGLLGLGRRGIYRKLFANHYEIEGIEFNGLLIGPDSGAGRRVVDLLNHPFLSPLLGWMNPKLFISLRKPAL